MNQEVPINEKFSGSWRVIWLFVIVIFGLMLLVSAMLRNLEAIGGLFFCIALACVYTMVFQRISRRQRPKWFLAGDGVIRAYASREPELITWGQMQDMKHVAGFGLIIQWGKPQSSSGPESLCEVVRSNLGVDQEEANRLLSVWRSRKTGVPIEQTSQQQALRVPSPFYKLQGGKLIFAGMIALIAFAVEAHRKNWLAAVIFAAITGIILVLGFRLTRKSR